MNFIKELFSSIKQQSTEKVTSIYSGTFAISWLAVNWKVITYFLLSKITIEEKLKGYTDYFPKEEWLSSVLWKPLIISLVVIAVVPLLNTLADAFKIGANLVINKFQRKFPGYMSPNESKKLLKKIEILESEQAPLFIVKDEEIDKLKKEKRELEQEISKIQTIHIKEIETVKTSINQPLINEKNKVKAVESEKLKIDSELKKCNQTLSERVEQLRNNEESIQRMHVELGKLRSLHQEEIELYPQYAQMKTQITHMTKQVQGLNEKLKDEKQFYETAITKFEAVITKGVNQRESAFQNILNRYESSLLTATHIIDEVKAD